jgi:hypothetical protein
MVRTLLARCLLLFLAMVPGLAVQPAVALDAVGLKVTWQTLPDHACFGPCPQWLALTGKIDQEGVATVREALKRHAGVRLLLVHSPGGHVDSAMAIGRLARQNDLSIVVARTIEETCSSSPVSCMPGHPTRATPQRGYCVSACVHLLAGGTERAVLGDGYVGVHRFVVKSRTTVHRLYRVYVRTGPDGRTTKVRELQSERQTTRAVNEEEFDTEVYAAARRYFGSMGVSPDLVGAIETTAHADVRRLVPAEMSGWSLTTTDSAPLLFALGSGDRDELRIVLSARIRLALQTVVMRRKPGERRWRAEAWITDPGSLARPAPRSASIEVPDAMGAGWSGNLVLFNGAYAGPPWSAGMTPASACALLAAPRVILRLVEDPGGRPAVSQHAVVDASAVRATRNAVGECGARRAGPV